MLNCGTDKSLLIQKLESWISSLRKRSPTTRRGKAAHFETPRLLAFRSLYGALPEEIRSLADKNYLLLKSPRKHPSLHFKRLGDLWSVRVGAHYRALGTDVEDG